MNMDDLKHFLEIEQGISTVTRELCLDILDECEPSTQLRKKEMLGNESQLFFFLRRRKISAMIKLNIGAYLKGIDGFTRYLISDKCALFNAEKRSPTQSTQIKRFRTFFW